MDPSRITPEGLTADARTETHARRCAALRQLVELGHLSRGGDDDDDDSSDDDDHDDGDDGNNEDKAAAAAARGGGGAAREGAGEGGRTTPHHPPRLLRPPRDVAALVDLDALELGARALQRDSGFPPGALHTFAVKANPCEGVLRAFAALGFGAEVASRGELEAALAAGFQPSRVVFDSPCKTRAELRRALRAGARVNLDSLVEVRRVAALLEGTAWGRALRRAMEREQEVDQGEKAGRRGDSPPPPPAPPAPVIGVRVNPQVGSGSIAALSTATDDSKFGVPIGGGGESSERAALAAAFREHRWLRALHLHVGSQGVPLEAVAEGAARAWAFARDELPEGRLVAFDVGGGTPVDFSRDDDAPGSSSSSSAFCELARLLRARVSELWGDGDDDVGGGEGGGGEGEGEGAGRRRQQQQRLCRSPPLLITENGRALVAKAGCVAARVEYVKHEEEEEEEEDEEDEEDDGGGGQGEKCAGGGQKEESRRRRRPIAVCHAGADLLMRACYLPAQWSLRLLVVDGTSFEPRELQPGEGAARRRRTRDVAGPLCFQGDRLAVARPLPRVRQGDWVVLPDTGAYCLSMFSHYNSRQAPAVWGYRGGGQGGKGGGGLRLELLRRGDTLADVLAFWSLGGRGGRGGGGGGQLGGRGQQQ